jgi:SAM-dependent methyltransferase
MGIKSALKRVPVIGPAIRKLRAPQYVASSADYWESRYRSGGDSGAGSYNRLASFKAKFLNDFVADQRVQSVIEFGSGDGAQLALAKYPRYTGIDVSKTAIDVCRKRFANEATYAFLHSTEVGDEVRAELTLSLDVIYHLVEDEVFDSYMHQLFGASTKWVIIYASNEERAEAAHVRHRTFTRWIERNRPDFDLVKVVQNPYPYDPADLLNTSFADFYVYGHVERPKAS